MADSNGNGNSRKPFTMNLKPELMEEFKKFCEEHGYLPSRRIEILMKKDVEERGEKSDG